MLAQKQTVSDSGSDVQTLQHCLYHTLPAHCLSTEPLPARTPCRGSAGDGYGSQLSSAPDQLSALTPATQHKH